MKCVVTCKSISPSPYDVENEWGRKMIILRFEYINFGKYLIALLVSWFIHTKVDYFFFPSC